MFLQIIAHVVCFYDYFSKSQTVIGHQLWPVESGKSSHVLMLTTSWTEEQPLCDSNHGCLQSLASKSPLSPQSTETIISSPASTVDHNNHNPKGCWTQWNICFYAAWSRTEAGVCSLCHHKCQCSLTHSLTHSPLLLEPSAKETACEVLAPWSQHISLMPKSVELFLTPSPGWHRSPPDRQKERDRQTGSLT